MLLDNIEIVVETILFCWLLWEYLFRRGYDEAERRLLGNMHGAANLYYHMCTSYHDDPVLALQDPVEQSN